VAAHGDAITAEIKLAWSTSALPSDATVRAATALTGTDVSTAGPLAMTPGQTLYVGAFGYAADGTESVRANLAAVYVSTASVQNQYALQFGWGDKSTVVLVGAEASATAPWPGTIIAWKAWTDDGADVTADYDVMRSAAVDPPVFASM